jgi:hypothetical protein
MGASAISRTQESKTRLTALAAELALLELDVEFYFIGGAVMYQAFRAHPVTAHVSALFAPTLPVREAAARLAAREGWPYEWLSDAVRGHLGGNVRPGEFLELPNLRLFIPPTEYALAVKVAALRLGQDPRDVDDVRYLLRSLNIASANDALAVVTRYFADRQLTPAAKATLETLLSG